MMLNNCRLKPLVPSAASTFRELTHEETTAVSGGLDSGVMWAADAFLNPELKPLKTNFEYLKQLGVPEDKLPQ